MTAAILFGLSLSFAFIIGYVVSAALGAGRADDCRAEWHHRGRQLGLMEGRDAAIAEVRQRVMVATCLRTRRERIARAIAGRN